MVFLDNSLRNGFGDLSRNSFRNLEANPDRVPCLRTCAAVSVTRHTILSAISRAGADTQGNFGALNEV
jgi:hypothetical protein